MLRKMTFLLSSGLLRWVLLIKLVSIPGHVSEGDNKYIGIRKLLQAVTDINSR
jgi:hypothetical protein